LHRYDEIIEKIFGIAHMYDLIIWALTGWIITDTESHLIDPDMATSLKIPVPLLINMDTFT